MKTSRCGAGMVHWAGRKRPRLTQSSWRRAVRGYRIALLEQLRIGGRLVIPVGEEQESQQLIRAIRRGDDEFEYEDIGAVRFVPLIGEARLAGGRGKGQRPNLPKRTAQSWAEAARADSGRCGAVFFDRKC